MEIFNFVFNVNKESKDLLEATCRDGFESLYRDHLSLPTAVVEAHSFGDAVFVRSGDGGEISYYKDGPLFIVVYGEILGLTAADAIAIAEKYGVDKMIEDMTASDGCFGALFFDSRDGTARIFGDSIGQRCLRHTSIGGVTYVSSHDVGIAMMGVSGAPNLTSLAEVHKNGWVIGGASLLSNVEVCRPSELLTISANNISKRKLSDKISDQPVDDLALSWLEYCLQKRGSVLVELSAGFDSRASLAATLAIRSAKDITAFSEGPADSMDVKVAEQIAKRAGISFYRRQTVALKPENMFLEWSNSSVATNGNIDISVLASRQVLAGEPPLSVCGDGGEIYRGYYYPYSPFNIGKSKWRADAALAKVSTGPRIKAAVEYLRGLSRDEQEILDRFYATERFGVWNQKLMRDVNSKNRVSPFYSRKAARSSFVNGNDLHFNLIDKYLPSSLEISVNGEASAIRYQSGVFNEAIMEFHTLSGKIGRRVRSKMKRKSIDLEDTRNEILVSFYATVVEHPEWTEDVGFSKMMGRSMWQELGATRFLKICSELKKLAGSKSLPISC